MELNGVGEAVIRIREARLDDHAEVSAMCEGIWEDRDGDYLPLVFPDWIEGQDRRTVVAIEEERIIGIAQCVLVSPTEAWGQGLRVHEQARGEGVAASIMNDLFTWARENGARVARSMVFSWNPAGMGVARGVGFEPTAEFRFVTPTPRDDPMPASVILDDVAGWQMWSGSKARTAMSGLGLDVDESWAMRELRANDMTQRNTLTVLSDGTAAMAMRGRAFEDPRDESRTVQEYATSAWRDPDAAATLLSAIAVDAAEQGATATRVLVPEGPRYISDVAAAGSDIHSEPHFVFSADLTAIGE